jgi:hypothetical protein
VFFDAGLRWGTQARYVQKRCLQRLNFLKSIAGVWWGAHPRCMIMGPCWIRVRIWLSLLLWNGQDSYATIGKGSVSRDKDSSETPVFDPKQ